jgi:phosphatidylglycerol:prolipoprotein diacylglycerol transferase
VRPELVAIGPVSLSTFGALMAVALVVGWWFVRRDLQERGWDPRAAIWLVGAAGLGGFLGARAWYAVTDPDGALVSGSGLTWYGGVIGGAAGVALLARWWGIPPGTAGNVGAPALAVGYAIGRLGCQMAGDGDYGTPSSLPWAMAYPDGTVPTDVAVHPTPLYEAVAMLVVFWVLWRLRVRLQAPWALLALWAVLAGTERFLVEFVRRNPDWLAGLTAAQAVSLVLVAAGAGVLAATRAAWRGPRPRPAQPAA